MKLILPIILYDSIFLNVCGKVSTVSGAGKHFMKPITYKPVDNISLKIPRPARGLRDCRGVA